MSIHTRTKRMTVPQLVAMKGQQKIVSLTAYSTAMVGYGRPSTLSMQLEEVTPCRRACKST